MKPYPPLQGPAIANVAPRHVGPSPLPLGLPITVGPCQVQPYALTEHLPDGTVRLELSAKVLGMEPTPETFGQRLRRQRLDRDDTLREFSAKVGVSPTVQSSVERDAERPTDQHLAAIAREFWEPLEEWTALADATIFEDKPIDLSGPVFICCGCGDHGTETTPGPLDGEEGAEEWGYTLPDDGKIDWDWCPTCGGQDEHCPYCGGEEE